MIFFREIDYLISNWTERLQLNHVFIELEIEFSKEQFYRPDDYIKEQIDDLFEGFRKKNVFKSMKLAVLMGVYVFLWSLLLIVPGIIKGFSYSMAYYIMLDHPEYTASEALQKSQEMMKGHKLDLFILCLSFIGWFILGAIIGIFTFSIPFLWIYPYYMTTISHFYLNLVNRDTVMEEKTVI